MVMIVNCECGHSFITKQRTIAKCSTCKESICVVCHGVQHGKKEWE